MALADGGEAGAVEGDLGRTDPRDAQLAAKTPRHTRAVACRIVPRIDLGRNVDLLTAQR
ncbi:MAG: hypothetical protein M0Z87_04490 [Actinomycetota bacterium]|nr:hypothetical protein [Actinomycetota bacterium]